MKIVGKINDKPPLPEECLRKAQQLNEQMNLMNPYPQPRGFIFKARTWKDYENWRKKQSNPRQW